MDLHNYEVYYGSSLLWQGEKKLKKPEKLGQLLRRSKYYEDELKS